MLVNPESPDLLLPYMHGTGGRLIIHLVMLSPEVHTWSAKVEEELLAIPVDQHVAYKLEYIKRHVFPMVLKDRIEDWKKFEPQPWGLTFPKTKKFIRHAWMKESLDDLLRFRCDKIAYTDFTDCLYFAIRAVIAKNTFGIGDPNPAAGQSQWYRADTEEETIEIVVRQLNKAVRMLNYWKSQASRCHVINVAKLLFDCDASFTAEYLSLCKYYQVTPQLDEAEDLVTHWKTLQWKRES